LTASQPAQPADFGVRRHALDIPADLPVAASRIDLAAACPDNGCSIRRRGTSPAGYRSLV
jgi:hypothetical protein